MLYYILIFTSLKQIGASINQLYFANIFRHFIASCCHLALTARNIKKSTAKEGEKGETTPAKLVGRRIVELDLLSKELDSDCQTCGSLLKLSNCVQETVHV